MKTKYYLKDKDVNKLYRFAKMALRSSKLSWITSSDILLSNEDMQQDVVECFLKEKHQELLLNNDKLLMTFTITSIKDIKRRFEAEKRGGLVKHGYIEDAHEHEIESASLLATSSTIRADVRGVLFEMQKGNNTKDINILVDYYAFGYTMEELAEEYKYSHKSGAEHYLARALKRMTPDLKVFLADLQELRSG